MSSTPQRGNEKSDANVQVSRALSLALGIALLIAGAVSGEWLPAAGIVCAMGALELLGRSQEAAAHASATNAQIASPPASNRNAPSNR